MNRFGETLQEINRRLDLPQPAKSRVVLEIAADLEDLHRHFRESGLTDIEAYKRAIEQCDLSDEALFELTHIHTTPWRRFLDQLSAQGQSRWERGLLILLLAFIAVTTGRLLFSTEMFRVASAAVWPILGITGAAVVISAHTFYLAYLKQEHNLARLRAGLPLLASLAGGILVTGMYGYWLGLYRVARQAALDADSSILSLIGWLTGSSAMLMVCFVCTIVIALMWYMLANKVSRIEQAEAAVLLLE